MRASAAFRFASELIYPEKGRFDGPNGQESRRNGWTRRISRSCATSKSFLDRGSCTTRGRSTPVEGLSPATASSDQARDPVTPEDPFWNDPTLTFFDPHAVAWVNRSRSGRRSRRSFRASRRAKSESVQGPLSEPATCRPGCHARVDRAGHPERRGLPGLAAHHRRRAGTDYSGEHLDARGAGLRRAASTRVFVCTAIVSGRARRVDRRAGRLGSSGGVLLVSACASRACGGWGRMMKTGLMADARKRSASLSGTFAFGGLNRSRYC